jgi:hypothetical protein
LKAGDRMFVFPNLYPATVVSVGAAEGRNGEETKVYLSLDSDGSRIMARARSVWLKRRAK